MKVCFLTSVHHRRDTRIFIKEIPGLLRAGYDVCALVADGKGEEIFKGYKIYDVGAYNSRLERMFITSKKIYNKAVDINADAFHFHDPELIPVGLKLLRAGKKVIYDVHEDVPRDIMSKEWLPGVIRRSVAGWFEKYENHSAKKFHYIVTATSFIHKRFVSLNKHSVTVNNFPILDELIFENTNKEKEKAVCYIGEITKIRAAEEMVRAMENIDGKFFLAGSFESEKYRNELMKIKGWNKVKEFGFVNRDMAKDILSRSRAGLVIFHPEPNHINAQPNKIFEYMSAGIPVIGSNFPLWKEIIEGNECGICVEPFQSENIGSAIKFLLDNPDKANEMGKKGRIAVEQEYNWEQEEKKLIDVYKQLKNE